MTKDNFIRYAELKNQVIAVEAELDVLKPQLLADLESVDDKPVELEGTGTFIVAKRKNWKWTAEWQRLKAALDERQKEEQAKGLATYREERTLMFKPVKIDNI